MGEPNRDAIRVLLLEDSDIDAELLAHHLAKANMIVALERVTDRPTFVAALERGKTDIILADYSLPDFDGLAALNISRKHNPDIPFIFVSGVVGEEFATNAIKHGATDYVVKRTLSRLPGAVDRALAETRERAERQRAEAAVRALNATLEQQVEARTAERDRIWRLSRELFAVADASGGLHAVNPAWNRVLGYDLQSLLSTPFPELIHSDDHATVWRVLNALQNGSASERFEVRLKQATGGYRWIAWTTVVEGSVFYAVGRDVTEERRSADELAEANRNLREQIAERERVEATLSQMQRLEAVGQLTSGVAHDFNNLLTVILGNIAFVERSHEAAQRDEKLKQRLGHMRSAAERGAKLTSQLLAFSRRQRLEPKVVDLNDTVLGMRDLLESTMGGSVRLETSFCCDLWPALVDPTQIEMIILNLAINARDAMEVGGSLTVKTSNAALVVPPSRPEEPTVGDYVVLTVSDTGSGMSAEVLARAFEPFFTTKAIGKGSGLGLAQVFGFAKQSGGGVRIETCPGEGTSVKVYLPRARTVHVETAPPVAPRRSTPLTLHRRILLVDDDNAVREITAAMLRELGYAIVEASSGRAALDLLAHLEVDLLLIDFAMPGMSGVETATEAQRLRPELPSLFITGFADLGALKNIGEEQIVSKPFRENELVDKIEAAFGRSTAPPDAEIIQLHERTRKSV